MDDLDPEEVTALNTALEDYQGNSSLTNATADTQLENEDSVTLEATPTSEINEAIPTNT